jgi:hypothetical protein
VGGGRLLLGQQAADRRDRFDDDAAAAQLAKLIERRREELQREAMKLAHRLLRKKPGKVVRPLEKRTPPRSWVWELDALVRSFAGEPVLHDPLRGRIKGARAFESYVRVMSRPHPPATSPKDRRRAAPSRGL